MNRVDAISVLPENTGFAVALKQSMNSSMLMAYGQIQGYTYKARAPRVRFAIRIAENDSDTLLFVCNGVSDKQLLETELFHLLREFRLVPDELNDLRTLLPQRPVRSGTATKTSSSPRV
ncbi:MAG: hypothetical protein WBP40_03115 [Candidatus Moraniibacteriota bacterium]